MLQRRVLIFASLVIQYYSEDMCVQRVSIFLIAVALIAGMLGCEPTPSPTPEYDLTIASTAGGNVTTPGEGTFTYDEGTMVNLTAEAEGGYHFLSWTGDVGTIINVESATTTISMNGNHSITANFEAEFMIAAGAFHTVGLESDGTMVAVGDFSRDQCDVDNWTDIVQVSAGLLHTVGTKDDGSVVAVGANFYGQCNVGGWTLN